MLRIAAADGIGTIVATPHAHHVRTGARVVEGVQRLQALADAEGIAVTLRTGHECRVASNLGKVLRQGEALTINDTDWVLIECYLSDDWPVDLIVRAFRRTIVAGYRPILAHAERFGFVQRDWRALLPIVEMGIPVQINAGSLFLPINTADRRTAERLLAKDLVQFVASDAHNARYRPPQLRAALDRIAELAGPERALELQANAARVLAGEDVASGSRLDLSTAAR